MIVALLCVALAGESGWRGDGTGVFVDPDPPTAWSATSHVTWHTALPTWSNASPVVAAGRVFVTAEPTSLVALDAATGRVLWRHAHDVDVTFRTEAERADARAAMARIPALRQTVLDGQREVGELRRQVRAAGSDAALLARLTASTSALESDRRTLADLEARFPVPPAEQSVEYASGFVGWSASTPVTDGRIVYAVFANGVVAARAFDGTLRWAVRVGAPSAVMRGYHEGHAASPRLVGDTLVVGLGELVGLDAATGAVRWRAGDSPDFGTPAVLSVGGVSTVITPGGDVVRARDGAVLTRLGAPVWYVGPVVLPDRVLLVGNRSDAWTDARAWTVGASGLTFAPAWTVSLPSERYYAQSCASDGRLHVVARMGRVAALDLATGAERYAIDLKADGRGVFYASPSCVGNLVYATSEDGTTTVLRAGPTSYTRMAENTLEPLRSSLFFGDGAVFVRTLKGVWRIE